MPRGLISSRLVGDDTLRTPQKTTSRETANDGRAGSRAPFKSSRPPKEPQKHVPGHLTYPVHLVVPVVWRLCCVGSQGGLLSTQTEALACQVAQVGPPGERIGLFGEMKTSKRQSTGTTGRPTPKAGRRPLFGRRERRIRPLWQPKVENEPRRLGAAVSLSSALGSGQVPLSDSKLVSEVSVATLRSVSK